MKKRNLRIFVVLALVLASAGVAYRVWAGGQSTSAADVQTTTVTRGSVTSTLSASGNTRSGQSATLVWETSGKVGEISLQAGDLVEENQVLAALAPGTLSQELIQARQELIAAQQAMDDLLNSKLQQVQVLQAVEDAQEALNSLKQTAVEDSSQAMLALANAQEALKDAEKNRVKMNYPHTSDELVIEKAETEYLLAKQAHKEALKAFQEVERKALTNPERVRALSELVAAKQKMDTALATYNWYLMGYTEIEVAQAEAELAVASASLEKAQSDWETLKNGTSATAIALAEAVLSDAQREWERVKDGPSQEDIAAAQADIDIAQAKLDKAQLLAPFSGTLTEVSVDAGDLVSSGDQAFRIDDLASLYIDLQISEVDLASLQVGQPATIEFDAIADREYSGQVVEIGMIGSVSQGVVNYPVVVQVTDADASIRPGMTASVTIITAQAEDVLLVPNKAIRTVSGQRIVTVLFEGQQISVPVTIGLAGDTMTQVTSEQLREGDAVVINGSTAAATTSSNTRSMEGFIPGGMPPGGMP